MGSPLKHAGDRLVYEGYAATFCKDLAVGRLHVASKFGTSHWSKIDLIRFSIAHHYHRLQDGGSLL